MRLSLEKLLAIHVGLSLDSLISLIEAYYRYGPF